jgi:hypothetical protein
MSEAPLKFPDLPVDHPANAVTTVVEPTQAQTEPVAVEASASTELEVEPAASAPASEEPTADEEAAREAGPPAPAIDSAGQPLNPEPIPASTIAPSGVAHDGSVYRARSDDDVLTNSFCRVIAGPYTGRYGVFWSTANLGADGWPDEVVVRTRDAEDENIVVKYADIRPDVAGRR